MKRSQMLAIIRATLRNYGVEPCPNKHDDMAEDILNTVEEFGMLPPTNTCTIVPDEVHGGFRHSETKRAWDEEV